VTKIGGPVAVGRSSENLYELTSTSGTSKPTNESFLEGEGLFEERGERVNGDLFKWDSGVFRVFWNS
jgi:hypothetical protein